MAWLSRAAWAAEPAPDEDAATEALLEQVEDFHGDKRRTQPEAAKKTEDRPDAPTAEAPVQAAPEETPTVSSSKAPPPRAAPTQEVSGQDEVGSSNTDEPDEPAAPPPPEEDDDETWSGPSFSHHNQGSLTVAAGWGFGAVLPYVNDAFCGEFIDDPGSETKRKSFCTGAVPWFMEFTGGFGVHPRIDVVLGVRLNVQKREFKCKDDADPETCKGLFNDSLAVGLTPGIRAWISRPERRVKIGGAVDFVWTHENFSGYRGRSRCTGPTDTVGGPCPVPEGPIVAGEHDIKDDDIGVRLGPVLQIEPHRNVGIVLSPLARLGFLRWFEFSFDVSLGVQARFP